MKKVLTFGVFDLFHLGHLRLFKQAKEYGDFLIVAIQDNKYVHKNKPGAQILYTNEQKEEIISSLRIVDQVTIYTDADISIKNIDFDILAVGEDQNNQNFKNAIAWCKNNNKKIVRLKRTPGICSSEIKNEILK